MATVRIDNVAIVVEDLDAAVTFFSELGLQLEGRSMIEGEWADRVVGLSGLRSEVAMMRTADGQCALELTRFQSPAAVKTTPGDVPTNALGMGRVMFAVDDIDDVVKRLEALGATVVDEIVRYEDFYRLCYLRGPEGVVIALAQKLD